jgi:hypothetical protein
MKGIPVTITFVGTDAVEGGGTYFLKEEHEEDAGGTVLTTVASSDIEFQYDCTWYNIIVDPILTIVVDPGPPEVTDRDKHVQFVQRGYTKDFQEFTLTVSNWKNRKLPGWIDPFELAETPDPDPELPNDQVLASQTTIVVSKLGTLDR